MRAVASILVSVVFILAVMPFQASAGDVPTQTLFTNCNVFDGLSDKLVTKKNVLVEQNLIKNIGDQSLKGARGARVIDCDGRTLMPGLIESHVHVNLQHMIGGYDTIEHRDWQEIGAMGAFTAQSLLKDGWTSIRDSGASLTGLKTVIDRGELDGLRMYQANAVISQTAGHGDFRLKGQRRLSDRYTFRGGELGMTHIVDG